MNAIININATWFCLLSWEIWTNNKKKKNEPGHEKENSIEKCWTRIFDKLFRFESKFHKLNIDWVIVFIGII